MQLIITMSITAMIILQTSIANYSISVLIAWVCCLARLSLTIIIRDALHSFILYAGFESKTDTHIPGSHVNRHTVNKRSYVKPPHNDEINIIFSNYPTDSYTMIL